MIKFRRAKIYLFLAGFSEHSGGHTKTMGKFSKAGIHEAQQTQRDANKTATSDQFWRFLESTRKEPQKLNIENGYKVEQYGQKTRNVTLKSQGFNVVKGGYNRFGVFAVIFGLMFCLTLQAWLPAWAHKFGEFPGKGSKETWKRANYYAIEGQRARKDKECGRAIELLGQAIKIYGLDGVYFFERGLSFEARNKPGDLILAEKDFKRAAQLSPDEWQVWECLGHALYEQGRKSECEPFFRRALSCNPPERSKTRIEKNIQTLKTEIQKADEKQH
jgi:tetratricopeptide (TPR) repeat protein